MSKWGMVRLGDVSNVQGGYAFKSDSFRQNEIPIVRIGDIHDDTVSIDNSVCYPLEFWENNVQFRVLVGDILIAMSGATVGKIGLYGVNDKALLNQRVGKICIDNKRLFNKYVFAVLKSDVIKLQIQQLAAGCAQPNISGKQLENLLIPLPPLTIQQKIANVLDKASTLIEKRKAQIDKLDLLIKSQFMEMFGDPVTNPKGWNTSLLKDVCTFGNGKAHEQHIDEKGSYKLVTSKFIASEGVLYRKTNCQLSPLYKDDICMVMSDVPNGRALAKCFMVDVDNMYSLNQRICVFRTNSFNLVFLYSLLNRHPYFLSFNDGDSQTNLRKEEILNCKLIIPPSTLQDEFAAFVEQVEEQKKLMQQSLEKLELNYKSLMQKCFRGEMF